MDLTLPHAGMHAYSVFDAYDKIMQVCIHESLGLTICTYVFKISKELSITNSLPLQEAQTHRYLCKVTPTPVYIQPCTNIHTDRQTDAQTCMHIHAHAYTHAHACTHTIHVSIHTHTHHTRTHNTIHIPRV